MFVYSMLFCLLFKFFFLSTLFLISLLCWVRSALARHIPCLGVLLCVPHGERLTSSSFMSTRRSTVTSQASETGSNMHQTSRTRLSSMSDSESVWTHLYPSITVFFSLIVWFSQYEPEIITATLCLCIYPRHWQTQRWMWQVLFPVKCHMRAVKSWLTISTAALLRWRWGVETRAVSAEVLVIQV